MSRTVIFTERHILKIAKAKKLRIYPKLSAGLLRSLFCGLHGICLRRSNGARSRSKCRAMARTARTGHASAYIRPLNVADFFSFADGEVHDALSCLPPHRRFRTAIIAHRSELCRLLRRKLRAAFRDGPVSVQTPLVGLRNSIAAYPGRQDRRDKGDKTEPRSSRIDVGHIRLLEKICSHPHLDAEAILAVVSAMTPGPPVPPKRPGAKRQYLATIGPPNL
jgi:hypothetical protein